MRRPSLPLTGSVTGLVVGLVLALAGCQSEGGGGPAGSPDEPSPDVSAIRDGLATQFAGDHPGSRENTEGACFAEKLTAAVSPEQLRKAGVLDASYDVVTEPPPLPADVAGEWADAQLECADFVEASTRAQVKVTKGDLDGPRYAACLRESLTQAQIRAAIASSLRGDFDDAAVADLSEAQATCARRSPASAD
jgi:hypothetical protein